MAGLQLVEQGMWLSGDPVDQPAVLARLGHEFRLQTALPGRDVEPVRERLRAGVRAAPAEHGRQRCRTALVALLWVERHFGEFYCRPLIKPGERGRRAGAGAAAERKQHAEDGIKRAAAHAQSSLV